MSFENPHWGPSRDDLTEYYPGPGKYCVNSCLVLCSGTILTEPSLCLITESSGLYYPGPGM